MQNPQPTLIPAAAPGHPAPVLIRPSTETDVPAMLAIYSHHIRQGIGDMGPYEEEPLQEEDIRQRRKNMRKKRLPHLVADVDGAVAGYAYAVPFRKRPAYRYALKHSIYIHHDYQHCGIGRRLLPALIDACRRAGYFQLIGYIDSTNEASLNLHEACGFHRAGLLKAVGLKYGRWTDSVMMQMALIEDPAALPGPWAADPPTGRDAAWPPPTPRLE